LALSYFVTAIWLNIYIPKLILIVGILAVMGVGAVLSAMFKRRNNDFTVAGKVIDQGSNPRPWSELSAICDRVGTAKPDRVVVGIDDNFFVTETPVLIDGQQYT